MDKIIIRAQENVWRWNLKQLLEFSDLIAVFIKRDFSVKYKQTLLGPLWHVISPLITSIMYVVVFNKVARIPTDGIHPVVFYYGGILGWTFFSNSLTGVSNVFLANLGLFSKVFYPRLVNPIALIATNAIQFAVQWLSFYGIILFLRLCGQEVMVGWTAVFIPFVLIALSLMSFGIGAILSSVTIKYRDLNQLLGFGMQLWMYVTPIIYPRSAIPKEYSFIVDFNPIAPLIELMRFLLAGSGEIYLPGIIFSLVFAGGIAVIGLFVFNRVEKDFIDVA